MSALDDYRPTLTGPGLLGRLFMRLPIRWRTDEELAARAVRRVARHAARRKAPQS